MRLEIKDKRHLQQAAVHLLKLTPGKRIYAFYGPMGAGKTTIIKSVCNELGAVDIISSPTFTLVNEYMTDKGEILYHIDFYRIKKVEEVYDFGIEDYLSGEHYCFMEWPELVESILPDDIIRVKITVGPSDERILDVT